MSRLWLERYSYTRNLESSSPSWLQPIILTRFRCCRLLMSFISFKNCSLPWLFKFISFFMATLSPFSRVPYNIQEHKLWELIFKMQFFTEFEIVEFLIVLKPGQKHFKANWLHFSRTKFYEFPIDIWTHSVKLKWACILQT